MLIDHNTLSAALATGLIGFCRVRSIDLNAALVASDITSAEITNREGRISVVKFSRLLHQLASQAKDPCFGLSYASHFKLGDTGIFGLGIMNAPSFGHAVRFYTRFLPLAADHATFNTDISADSVVMKWRYTPFLLERAHYVDFCLLLTLRQFRLFAGEMWLPRAVHLRRERPHDIAHLQRAFCPNLKFSSEYNVLEFSSRILSCELEGSDNRLFEIIEKQCEMALEAKNRLPSVEDLLGDVIVNGLTEKAITLDLAAAHVGFNPRNLQRLLAHRNLSFEKIVTMARHELSDCLLLESGQSLDEISHKLGYASASAYSRAASSWYGEAPRNFRNRLLSARNQQVPKINNDQRR
jgi:AraC-like DNA-binding protein